MWRGCQAGGRSGVSAAVGRQGFRSRVCHRRVWGCDSGVSSPAPLIVTPAASARRPRQEPGEASAAALKAAVQLNIWFRLGIVTTMVL